MRRIGWSALVVLAVAVGGAACGDDDDEGGGAEGADGEIDAFCEDVDEYVEAIQEADAESVAEISPQAQELSARARELIPTLDTEGAQEVSECMTDLSSAVPGG